MPPTVPTDQKLNPVTITFSSPGAQPPVFVAGDFTQPPWDPQRMDAEEADGADIVFRSTFALPAGNYQYKFRLGTGDWWVCDETAEKVTTDDGIANNRLVVQDASEALSVNDSKSETGQEFVSAVATRNVSQANSDPSTPVIAATSAPTSSSVPVTPGMRDKTSMQVDVKPTPKQMETLKDKFEERGHDPYAGVGDDDATPLDGPGAPLLPHEIGAPPPTPPDDALASSAKLSPVPSSPALASARRTFDSLHKKRSNSIVPQAPTTEDLNDPNVERFPADRQNILKRIQTLKHKLPEDETREIEAIVSSEDELSEAGSRDASDESLPEPAIVVSDTGNSVKSGADIATRSHEHLDSVPEYDEPVPSIKGSATESAGAGIPQPSWSDIHDDPTKTTDRAPIAGINGASEEHICDGETANIVRSRSKQTADDESREHVNWTDDEYADARSDTPLIATQPAIGIWERLWSRVQKAARCLWQFVSRCFQKTKSD